MKSTKAIFILILIFAGCSRYEPFIVPATHPASLEAERQSSAWKGPNALTVSPSEDKDEENEVPTGSAHKHMHMQGDH